MPKIILIEGVCQIGRVSSCSKGVQNRSEGKLYFWSILFNNGANGFLFTNRTRTIPKGSLLKVKLVHRGKNQQWHMEVE